MKLALLLLLLLPFSAMAQNKPGLDAPLTDAQIKAAMVRVHHERYPHRVLDSFDQFVGALTGRPNDQTISSATEIMAHKKKWYHVFAVPLNDGLDLIQRSHGQLAQAGDLERAKELMKVDSKALTNESGVDVNPDIEIHLKLKR